MIENPTAFPCQEIRSGGFGIRESSDGMSLRDWFAGQAIGALVPISLESGGTPEVAATAAYQVADAMLAARKDA